MAQITKAGHLTVRVCWHHGLTLLSILLLAIQAAACIECRPVRPMKLLVTSLLLLLLATVRANPGWENKVIENVRIEVPTDCKTDVQSTPGAGGAVQGMKKYSFRTHVLDLEMVFFSFLPGTDGNLDGAAANMSSQLKAALGEEYLTAWKTTTVSGRPARYIATKPGRTQEAGQATLIDDTKAKNPLVIVDISCDSSSNSGKTDCEHIMKSVALE